MAIPQINHFEKKNKNFELKAAAKDGNLIKSKDRVKHYGEVFTPKWMIEKMLAEPAIQEKLHDLHATFLEPSAGEGAFLKEILQQKLEYVDQISNKTTWEDNALMALMSIYAIELLEDNLIRAKQAMMGIFANHYQAFMQEKLNSNADVYKSAKYVIDMNIVQGNTLTFRNSENKLIKFKEWIPSGNKVEQDTFTYKSLFNNDDIDDADANTGQLSFFDKVEDNDKKDVKLVKLTKVYENKNG